MSSNTLIISESLKRFLHQNKSVFSDLLLFGENPNTSKCNFITLRQGEKITYHPKPENQQFNANNDWKREGRQEIKPIGLIKLLFGEEEAKKIDNKELEIISIHIKNFASKLTIEESCFDVIYEDGFYNQWVRSSCMEGKESCVEFYNSVLNIFTPYIFKINNEVIGRSIKVKHNHGNYFDRIYFKKEEHEELIKSFLLEKGETIKKYQDYSNKTTFLNNEKGSFTQYVYCDIQIDYSDWIPYMDTLTYYNENGELTNEEEGAIYRFDSTNGDVTELEERVFCEDIQESVNIEYARYCDVGRYRGYYISDDNATVLRNGDVCFDGDTTYVENRNDYYLISDTVYSEYLNDSIHEDDSVYSEILGSYLLSDDAVYLEYCDDYCAEDQLRHSDILGIDIYIDHCVYVDEYGDFILFDKFLKVA